MNTLLVFAVVQAFNLVVLVWFNRVALVRILALRQQLSVFKSGVARLLRAQERLSLNEWVLSEGILPYAFVRSFGSAPNPLAPWFLKFCELAPIRAGTGLYPISLG
jgi:hypothetical protein